MGVSHRLRMASMAAMHSVTPISVSTANRSTPASSSTSACSR